MVICKLFNCLQNWIAHIVLNNLLIFLLNQEVAVVLGHFCVVGSWEADNWLRSCMTDIDTNQHCALLFKCLWELEIIEITADFTVHLSKNVSCFWQTEFLAIACSDYLRGHSILQHDFLKHFVVVFTLKDTNNNNWMVKLLITHHVLS